MNKKSKIYIAWHTWLVWSNLYKELIELWYSNIVVRTQMQLDLMDYNETKLFFEKEKIEYVFICAAKVWWIVANNTYPADFIYQNLMISSNIIHLSYINKVKKLLHLWSSCIYPKLAKQPIKEEYLLTWKLEPTNEPYAISKITWIKLCQSYNRQYWTNFIAAMPTNLYWPWDNYDLVNSHVIPWMIVKFHNAKINNQKSIILWWDWTPKREFLYSSDLCKWLILMMEKFNPNKIDNENWDMFLNIWSWEEITIKKLAEIIKKIVWFDWEINWDKSKPNWTPRKFLDCSKIKKLWFNPKIWLEEWIKKEYNRFLENNLN